MDMEKGPFNYYDNKSLKTDANIYWKVQHRFTKELSAYTDMQVRHVYYDWFGPNDAGIKEQQNTNYLFLIPKQVSNISLKVINCFTSPMAAEATNPFVMIL